jgi:hypothetical protein
MPGFDGTGPHGMGPFTGGARGYCIVPISPGSPIYMEKGDYPSNDVSGNKPDYGAWQNTPGAIPYASQITRKRELDFLKEQYQAMRTQLKHIEKRIQRLQNNRSAL